jgi:hypothetical protein
MFDFDIKSLGFSEEDINKIQSQFLCSISLEDWESMMLFENEEAIFKYLFIDNEDKESLIDTLLEMGKISVEDLDDGQSLMEYMIEDDDRCFKLPVGKWVKFTDDLLHKDKLAQID